MSITSTGDMMVDPRAATVHSVLKLQITYDSGTPAFTNDFTITITCRPVTSILATPTFVTLIPAVVSTSPTILFANPTDYYTVGGCPLTYAILKDSDSSPFSAPWFHITALG